jgi:Bacteriophage translational regulator
MTDNILDSLVWVNLHDPNDFLKIKETLTRIGVASRKDKKLYQSCHILHKQGRYAIVHFKELFALDGKATDFSEEDKARRNTIATLLEEWGLVQLVDPSKTADPKAPMNQIKVISYKEKGDWELCSKYSIGKTRRPLDINSPTT